MSNKYFPQAQNSPVTIPYRVFNITGVWIPETFAFPIITQERQDHDIAITPEPYSSPAFVGTAMRWQNHLGKLGASLKNGVGISADGIFYIGEGVNESNLVIHPPEALITANPVAGESIEAYSRIFASPTDNTLLDPAFHWQYKTIQHYDTWGHHKDCWHTGLWEHSTNHVYNYIFSKAVGMVDFWHGELDENNIATGVRFYYYPVDL